MGFTVTEQVAVLPPSVVVTVIVAVPAFFAVTTPEVETAATVVLFDDQLTVLSVAVLGEIVAVNCSWEPSAKDSEVLFSVMPVTAVVTVTVQEEVFPFSALTVIVAVPFPMADTKPD